MTVMEAAVQDVRTIVRRARELRLCGWDEDRAYQRACAEYEAGTLVDFENRPTPRSSRCPDCGEPGERIGHMGCQYPQDH